MSVSPSSLDLTIKTTTRSATLFSKLNSRGFLLALITIGMAGVVTAALDGWDTAIGLSVLCFLATVAAFGVGTRGQGAGDTIILVGRGTIASIIGSSLETEKSRARNVTQILRAATLAEAATLVRAVECNEVILAGDGNFGQLNLIDKRGHRPNYVSGPEAVERILGRVPMELVQKDHWFTRMGKVRTLAPSYVRLKRALDFSLALFLAVATFPVMLIAALLIRLDSPGPVIFRQQRLGLGRAPFEIFKFRTMQIAQARPEASGDWAAEVWTQQGDPRITKAGKFLRASRIDELPQLWNVLKGEMTFVGPRPEPVNSATVLEEILPEYPKRYAVLPGLTGWAQVCYGYTNSVDGQRRKVEYDLYYVKHASIGLDIRIMIKTAMVVLRLKGL